MGTKSTAARLAAIQAIYLMESSQADFVEHACEIDSLIDMVVEASRDDNLIKANKKLAKAIAANVCEYIENIDKLAEKYLVKQKSLSEITSLLRAIIRCSISELAFLKTPYKVVINEYTTITKDFFDIREVNFVNAILDKIAKDVRGDE